MTRLEFCDSGTCVVVKGEEARGVKGRHGGGDGAGRLGTGTCGPA